MSEPKPPAPDAKESYEVLKGLKFPKDYGLYAVDLLVKDLQAAQVLYDNQKALGIKLRAASGWIAPNNPHLSLADRLALANAIAERRRELAEERERERDRARAAGAVVKK
jgi:hypothetical protein